MRLRACAAGLLLAALAGCWFARPSATSNWLDRLRPFGGPVGADVVVLEIALLETPIGDKYVNQELWTGTDEQFLAPELRSVQEENGLRVALVHGRAPNQLQSMLTSERYNHNPRQRRLRAGDATVIDVGAKRALCSFELRTDGRTQVHSLAEALCQLQVTPTLSKDDKVHLAFVPQAQHFDRQRLPTVSATSALPLQNHRVTDPYAALKFDVVISPNEYVILGTRFDKPKSLGFQFFIDADAQRPVQRLLAIRAIRPQAGNDTAPPGTAAGPASEKLSLASQAALGR